MRRALRVLGLVAGLAAVSVTAWASDPVQVDVQVLDKGEPVVDANVVIYLSCDKVEGVTDEDGNVSLQSDCGGRMYWLEINEQRVNQLFKADDVVRTIDLDSAVYMDWQGGK